MGEGQRRLARLRYDFADYDLGDDTVAALEAAVRGVLREAFAAYAAEGCWTISGGARITWEVDPDAEGPRHWGAEFPVELTLGPADFVAAWERRLVLLPVAGAHHAGRRGPPPEPEDRTAALATLARWRTALDRVEQAIRAAAAGDGATGREEDPSR